MAGPEYAGNALATPRKEGTLKSQVSAIYETIASINEGNQEISRHLSRLLNPVPVGVDAGKTDNAPVPDTVESDLQSILRRLQQLRDDVSFNANRLNSAL